MNDSSSIVSFPTRAARAPHAEDFNRIIAGVHISSGCRRITAALVGSTTIAGEPPHVLAQHAEPTPTEVAGLYKQIAASEARHPGAAPFLAAQLAELSAAALRKLQSANALIAERVTVVGADDPGLWDLSGARRSYVSLGDAARLAELTGLNVIDAFPARDVALGGLGGPLGAIPLAMMTPRSPQPRVILDLGRTTRLTYIPGGETLAAARVLSFDVGPGTRLLDHLTSQLTDDQHEFDPGGRLAVQGRQITQLVEHWSADPYFNRPLPRWHPLGSRHDQELQQTVQMAIDAGWSVRDLLCTACHFIAEAIARAVKTRLPATPALAEMVLIGGGQHNGMLLRGLADRLSQIRFVRASDIGLNEDGLDGALAALLAQLHIDQVPANHTALTGASAPRVLGRLTPGHPSAWHRLLKELADRRPTTLPLRSAV